MSLKLTFSTNRNNLLYEIFYNNSYLWHSIAHFSKIFLNMSIYYKVEAKFYISVCKSVCICSKGLHGPDSWGLGFVQKANWNLGASSARPSPKKLKFWPGQFFFPVFGLDRLGLSDFKTGPFSCLQQNLHLYG